MHVATHASLANSFLKLFLSPKCGDCSILPREQNAEQMETFLQRQKKSHMHVATHDADITTFNM